MSKKDKHWVEHAHLERGALHRMMGIPEGKKIPKKRLEKASHGDSLEAKRARTALILSHLRKN